jgi:hypothetical protein
MAKIMKIAEALIRTFGLCSVVFVLVFLDISVKLLLKQPLHNHTHLFIKAHTKSRAFFNIVQPPLVPPPPGKVAFS